MSIGADGSIGEGQPVALTAADHDLDGVAEEPACGSRVAQIACAFQVFPCDLEGISSSWERETVMGGKRIRAIRVPSHLRLARAVGIYAHQMASSTIYDCRNESCLGFPLQRPCHGPTRTAKRTAACLQAGSRDGTAGGRASALGPDPALLREASGFRADPRAPKRSRRTSGSATPTAGGVAWCR